MPGLALEDGRKQPVRFELPDRRQELPRERDRVRLEVVAEREVAEHLEERVMPVGRPHVVEVVVLAAHAHALLRRRGSPVVASLLAEEQVLELVHPGVGEEQRRIVGRNQRRRWNDAMSLAREVVEKTLTNLVTGHVSEEIVSAWGSSLAAWVDTGASAGPGSPRPKTQDPRLFKTFAIIADEKPRLSKLIEQPASACGRVVDGPALSLDEPFDGVDVLVRRNSARASRVSSREKPRASSSR